MFNDRDSKKPEKLLTILIELNQWEWANFHILNSVIGRHVYFCIATELLSQPQPERKSSLKGIFNHPEYTDRAIRFKLREMEKGGYIKIVHSDRDKRVRFLEPTPHLIRIIEQHAKFIQKILDREFMMLEK